MPDVVVLTTDFSPAAEKAFAPAATLARGLRAEIVLLHVVQGAPHTAVGMYAPPLREPSVDAEVQAARQRLQDLTAKLPGDLRARAEVIVADNLADAIARFAEEQKAAYLVITSHGRSGMRRLVMGSVAESVLRKARLPVVVVPMQ